MTDERKLRGGISDPGDGERGNKGAYYKEEMSARTKGATTFKRDTARVTGSFLGERVRRGKEFEER